MPKSFKGIVKRKFPITFLLGFILFGMLNLVFTPMAKAGLIDSPWPKVSHDNSSTGLNPYF
ncbi:MAG: hypothetical protein AB1510_12920, partial [Bacillota bacterium]